MPLSQNVTLAPSMKCTISTINIKAAEYENQKKKRREEQYSNIVENDDDDDEQTHHHSSYTI